MRYTFVASIVLVLWATTKVDAQQAASVWENTGRDVKYVGTTQCVECHRDQHASYLQTTHSISAARTDPELEPESGTYEHPLSGFRYEVQRRDGKLVHREIMRDVDGNVLAETEYPMAPLPGARARASMRGR